MQPETIVKILTDVTGLFESTFWLHSLLAAHPEETAKVIPVIQNLGEAGSALAAAEQAAPNLTAAIKGALGADPLPFMSPKAVAQNLKRPENLLRSLAGVGHMTPDQERLWMDATTRNLSDSQAGGG